MARLSYLLACTVLFLTLQVTAYEFHEKQLIKQIKSAGYPIEVHNVTTDDSYILKMHRIEHRKFWRSSGELNQQPVALLLHGMMKTSASFINQGPNSNFAYWLADAGYDVWMGNTRGNPYSRAHKHLDPDNDLDKNQYFDFDLEDIATEDIPAMVDYITAMTNANRMTFVGDAEGATLFLILNSLKPEYNERFELAVLLNPVGYMDYFPSAELTAAAFMVDSLHKLGEDLGILEISSLNLRRFNLSDRELSTQFVLQSVMSYIASLGGFAPVGTSLKQLVHYGQNVRDTSFKRWDYGPKTNFKVYGTELPTSYNISVISVETVMYYRNGYDLLDIRDVQAMVRDMPKASFVRYNDTIEPVKYITDLT